jgi:nucleoid-associated protein YgaU
MAAAFQTLPAIAKKGPQLIWLLGLLSLFAAAPAHSQSLGDIARQERQRKQEQPPPPATHVYDNDDLARRQILLPEDKARIEASKQEAKPADSKPAVVTASGEVKTDAVPLGDVARQERQRKQIQTPRAPHVYSNADLARPQILLPEDRERFEASRQKVTLVPGEPAVQSAVNDLEKSAEPLGDVARRYRALEEVRKSLEAHPGAPLTDLKTPALAYPAFSRWSEGDFTQAASPRTAKMKKGPPGEAIASADLSGSGRIRIRAGDTLWKLARSYLGRGRDWPALAAENPQLIDPARLRVGTWLQVSRKAANPPPSRYVRVARGDSLWKLAQVQYGKARVWGCIARANPQILETNLVFPGQVLAIPGGCTNPSPGEGPITVSAIVPMPIAGSR